MIIWKLPRWHSHDIHANSLNAHHCCMQPTSYCLSQFSLTFVTNEEKAQALGTLSVFFLEIKRENQTRERYLLAFWNRVGILLLISGGLRTLDTHDGHRKRYVLRVYSMLACSDSTVDFRMMVTLCCVVTL